MGKTNKKLNLSREKLYNLYVEQKLPTKQIGIILGCTSKSVRNYLAKYNIPVRPAAEAVKLERSTWTEEKEQARASGILKNHVSTLWYDYLDKAWPFENTNCFRQ